MNCGERKSEASSAMMMLECDYAEPPLCKRILHGREEILNLAVSPVRSLPKEMLLQKGEQQGLSALSSHS